MISAYLDTCVVSGIAKGDLTDADADALLVILQAHKAGALRVVTSEVTAAEYLKVPSQYRNKHAFIYSLLVDVPVAQTHRTGSSLLLMGVGGGRREDPLFTQLKELFPTKGTRITYSKLPGTLWRS